MKEDSAPGPALALNVTQVTNNTLRPTTPKLSKHQTMTMTSVSRSTGRSDKAKRAQGNLVVHFCSSVVNIAVAMRTVAKHHCSGIQLCFVVFIAAQQTPTVLWYVFMLQQVLLHSSTMVTSSCVACGVAAEQHEQDMLEELDRMHEECATLQDDAQVSFLLIVQR